MNAPLIKVQWSSAVVQGLATEFASWTELEIKV